jgi:UDP-glucose 4-epimerase
VTTVVTGGTGFLGSAIALELMERGEEVTLFDRAIPGEKGLPVDAPFIAGDIRDTDALRRALEGADAVFHMSGVLGTSELQHSIREAVDVNVSGSVGLFELVEELGIRRVFYPSKPTPWSNVYTITKLATEQLVQMLNQERRTSISTLRYFNVFGPGQALVPIRKIVPVFAAQAMLGLPLTVFGDGEQTVDMVYSRDVARWTVDYAALDHLDSIPDCGSHVARTVNEVAQDVNAFFANRAGIHHVAMREGEDERTFLVGDATELEALLGPLAATDYEQALSETLEWYAELSDDALRRASACYRWDDVAPPLARADS